MSGELEQLGNRKAQLLIESEANRLTLAASFVPVRAAARWFDLGASLTRQSRDVAWLAVPVLGFWAARLWMGRSGTGGISTRGLNSVLQLAQSVREVWKSFKRARVPRNPT